MCDHQCASVTGSARSRATASRILCQAASPRSRGRRRSQRPHTHYPRRASAIRGCVRSQARERHRPLANRFGRPRRPGSTAEPHPHSHRTTRDTVAMDSDERSSVVEGVVAPEPSPARPRFAASSHGAPKLADASTAVAISRSLHSGLGGARESGASGMEQGGTVPLFAGSTGLSWVISGTSRVATTARSLRLFATFAAWAQQSSQAGRRRFDPGRPLASETPGRRGFRRFARQYSSRCSRTMTLSIVW